MIRFLIIALSTLAILVALTLICERWGVVIIIQPKSVEAKA